MISKFRMFMTKVLHLAQWSLFISLMCHQRNDLHGVREQGPQRSKIFYFFCKNNLILGLFW